MKVEKKKVKKRKLEDQKGNLMKSKVTFIVNSSTCSLTLNLKFINILFFICIVNFMLIYEYLDSEPF